MHEYQPERAGSVPGDKIAGTLSRIAHTVLIIVFGLLPLLFVPSAAAPFEYSKILFVVVGISAALIFYSLSVLRSGSIRFGTFVPLWLFWAFAAAALLAALLSGDFTDALIGDSFGIHTALFVVLLAVVATLWNIFGINKTDIMRLYVLLAASTLVVVLFHVVRLIFGSDVLTFGVFANAVSTPLGGWNDLALFLGLSIILSLVTLEQLPLTSWGRTLFLAVIAASLGMLSVVNFEAVWIVLGLVSLVLLVYTVGKDRLGMGESRAPLTPGGSGLSSALIPAVIVFVVSAIFFVSGDVLSGSINQYTNISYVEVRPSLEATSNIASEVYSDNAFLGIGPNKFSDAWRTFRDPAINNTIFWDTLFNGGSGYIPTFFVTTGLVGGILILLFIGSYAFIGARLLLTSSVQDKLWFYIGTSSFTAALYVLVLSFVYVPGTAMLLIGALFIGISFVAFGALHPEKVRSFHVGLDKRTGFVLTLAVMAVIIGSVAASYSVGRHYAAAYTFNKGALQFSQEGDVTAAEQTIARAYELSPNDRYARRIAEYQLAKMNALLGNQEPTEADQQEFQSALANGVESARLATERDGTDPRNWAVLGNIYSVLVLAGVEGAYDRAKEALDRARELDQQNPFHVLSLAQLEARNDNIDEARTLANEAVRLKPNYSQALYFLTQIEVAAGNTDAAVESTRAIISIEPNNPARHYQLGVLESARGNVEEAAAAFEQAVALDPDYANAMYFLALSYDELGRPEEAKGLLERVLTLNPGNENVISLIEQLESEGSLNVEVPEVTDSELPESPEGSPVQTSPEGDVTTTGEPDTPLITPVNTVPSENGTNTGNPEGTEESTDESSNESGTATGTAGE